MNVPASLPNIRDKRPHEFAVDENAQGCRHCGTFNDLEDEIRLIEIMILEQCRGQGIGSALIRLYERLGFRPTGGDDVQYEMAINPDLR